MLTLFHPATGRVRLDGVTRCPNAVLHPWLKQQLTEIVAELPEPPTEVDPATIGRQWARWQEGLSVRFTLPKESATALCPCTPR
jgi:hypothetical protein